MLSRLALAVRIQDWWEDGMDSPSSFPSVTPVLCCRARSRPLFYCLAQIRRMKPLNKTDKSKIREEIFVLGYVLGYSPSQKEEMVKCEAAFSHPSRWGRRVWKYRLDFSSLYSVWNWGPWDNAKYLYWGLLCSLHLLWNLFTDKKKGIAIQLINIKMNGYTRWRVRVNTKEEHSTSLSCWDVIFWSGSNPPLLMF